MGRWKRKGKIRVVPLCEQHRRRRGDYDVQLPNFPGARRCPNCQELRSGASFADVGPSRFTHLVNCERASCRFQHCAVCCDRRCPTCGKFLQVYCPCCEGRRGALMNTSRSHYRFCSRSGQCLCTHSNLVTCYHYA
jgi:hypothetical protein